MNVRYRVCCITLLFAVPFQANSTLLVKDVAALLHLKKTHSNSSPILPSLRQNSICRWGRLPTLPIALAIPVFNAPSRSKGLTPMKRLLLFSFGLFLFALPSRAQSVDASLSYSYFRLGTSGGFNQNGVSGSVAYNPIRWLGVVGDFGGYHGSPGGVSLNTYTYLVGPRLSLRNPSKLTPFAQALFGGSRVTVGSGGGSSNQFAYSVGGGVDIGLLPHLALRPQLDYVGLHNSGQTANCTRVSLGFVVHF